MKTIKEIYEEKTIVYEDEITDLYVTFSDVKRIFGNDIESLTLEIASKLGEFLVENYFVEADEYLEFDMTFEEFLCDYEKNELDFDFIYKIKSENLEEENEDEL